MLLSRLTQLRFALILSGLALSTLLASGCGAQFDQETYDLSNPYEAAAQYSAEHAGLAVLVYKSGSLVYQRYSNGGSASLARPIFSGTKSFNCAAAAAAIQDGLLGGLDDTVSGTITEWASDAQKSAITVRQLLNLSSGITQNTTQFLAYGGNKIAYAIQQPIAYAPGTHFDYGEIHLTIFSELIKRKLAATTHEDALAYLKRRVLDPIGLEYSTWVRDSVGNPMMSFGAVMTPSNWAKYAILLKDKGAWSGKQILPSATLTSCSQPGPTIPSYGLTLWLNSMTSDLPTFNSLISSTASPAFSEGGPNGFLSESAPADLFALSGLADNRAYVSPSLDIVIVRLAGGSSSSTWRDARFLKLILAK